MQAVKSWQVTDKPLDLVSTTSIDPWERQACGLPDGRGMRVPALGLAWAHCVNTRLLVTRRDMTMHLSCHEGDPEALHRTHTVRYLHVVWSPRLPHRSVRFEVREAGVFGTTDAATIIW